MQRWQCPIYNVILLKVLSDYVCIKLQCYCWFSFAVSLQATCAFLAHKNQRRRYQKQKLIKSGKRRNFPHFWSDQGFEGTLVNRTLPSVHEGSLKITLTILGDNVNVVFLFSKAISSQSL